MAGLVLLAGCAEPSADVVAPVVESYPRSMVANDCNGIGAAFDWVGQHERFRAPAEWEPDATDQFVTGLTLWFLDCHRLSWGPFERPARMVIDTAGLDTVPESCWRYNVTISFDTLQTIWVDDVEIVDWLRETYGMPAYYAEIESGWENGTVNEYAWEMTHEDGSVSWFRNVDDGQRNTGAGGSLFRLFWFNETSVSYMDWHMESQHSGPAPFYGHAEPPVTLADWHTQDIVASGGVEVALRQEADITIFKDMLCKHELS